jgi:hypothetical protein
MDHITTLEPRDGVLHIGNPTQGCRHCGSSSTKTSENGRVQWHHPSTECCPLAVTDQIAWREQELETLRREERDWRARQADLESRAAGVGKDAHDADAALRRSRAAYHAKLEERWRPESDALKAELARLGKKRAWLERENAQ